MALARIASCSSLPWPTVRFSAHTCCTISTTSQASLTSIMLALFMPVWYLAPRLMCGLASASFCYICIVCAFDDDIWHADVHCWHCIRICCGRFNGVVGVGLGCIFLFLGIYFFDQKNCSCQDSWGFFSCVFWRNFSQERGFCESHRNSWILPLSQDFFAGIPAGQEFLYLLQIPPDSSGLLRIPVPAKHCLALGSNLSWLSVK